MARARNIKPGILKNEVLGTADPLLTILFQGLWMLADREGRLEDRPLRVRAEIFPYRPTVDVDQMLTWLAEKDFIVRYDADGHKYISVNKFIEHQRPHYNEPPSSLPAPPTKTQKNVRGRRACTNVASASGNGDKDLALIPDSLIADSGLLDGRESKGRKRDLLFDALAEVSGSDPHTAGGHVAKVKKSLAGAKPPYTPEDVREFGERFAVLCSWAVSPGGNVRLPTLSEIEKYIGRIRSAKPDAEAAARYAQTGFEDPT